MGRKAAQREDQFSPDALAKMAIDALNEGATTTKAYMLGDHADHTWGIPIPSLAFQWVIGGSNVLPCQRYVSVSGETKNFKSTLMIQILAWHVMAGGIGYDIDNEGKTSASMLDAMTWWWLTPDQRKLLIFKGTESVEEWQSVCLKAIDLAKTIGLRHKGSRVPCFVSVDSLTGKHSENSQEKLAKEGFVQGRSFDAAARANQISTFLETISLVGTTCSVGYVRHLKQSMAEGAPGMPPQKKEPGGAAAGFKTSLSLRVTKLPGVQYATHATMPHPELPCEGHPLLIESHLSCLGPDRRKIRVELLWQYVDVEDPDHPDDPVKRRRQIMKYDWNGALGYLLWQFKYDANFGAYSSEKERLDKALYFVQKSAKTVKCEELGLDDVSFSEFGSAIENNPDIRRRVSNFLDIIQYKDVQTVDLDGQDIISKD